MKIMLDVLLKKFFNDRNALTKDFENEYSLNLNEDIFYKNCTN